MSEKDERKILLNKLQTQNENLKIENNKYKNKKKCLNNIIQIADDNFVIIIRLNYIIWLNIIFFINKLNYVNFIVYI